MIALKHTRKWIIYMIEKIEVCWPNMKKTNAIAFHQLLISSVKKISNPEKIYFRLNNFVSILNRQ